MGDTNDKRGILVTEPTNRWKKLMMAGLTEDNIEYI